MKREFKGDNFFSGDVMINEMKPGCGGDRVREAREGDRVGGVGQGERVRGQEKLIWEGEKKERKRKGMREQ